MKHRIKNIFTLMFVLIIVACSKKENNDDLVIKLNPNNATPVKLEEWFESIEIVKLETSSQSLISNCNKIIEYEGRYYIFDSAQRVVIVFNKLGKFIFSSNDFKGKGPGEYAGLVDFNLNLFNKEIEILDAMDTKIMTYSLDGSYKRTIQLAPEVLPLYCYYPVTKDIYAFYTKKSQQRDESLIFYSLSSGKIVNKTGKLPNSVNYFPTTMYNPFHTIDEHIYFNHIFPSNSIYSIDKEHVEITKRIELDFGEYNFKIDDLPKNRKKEYYRKFMLENKDKYAFIANIAENNKILFVHFFLNDKAYVAKVNKTTKESTIFYNVPGSIEQFPTVNLMKDDVLTYVCEPSYLKYYVSDKLLDSTSRNIISNVNNSDNPYIIRYTLKK